MRVPFEISIFWFLFVIIIIIIILLHRNVDLRTMVCYLQLQLSVLVNLQLNAEFWNYIKLTIYWIAIGKQHHLFFQENTNSWLRLCFHQILQGHLEHFLYSYQVVKALSVALRLSSNWHLSLIFLSKTSGKAFNAISPLGTLIGSLNPENSNRGNTNCLDFSRLLRTFFIKQKAS